MSVDSRHPARGRASALASLLGAIWLASAGAVQATADGPDHYRVRGVAPDRHLMLRASPAADAPVLARIPGNATCLRNLGCQGGLTFAEFTTLGEAEKRRIEAERPRWCKVDFQGTVGWAAGRYLAEGACPSAPTPSR